MPSLHGRCYSGFVCVFSVNPKCSHVFHHLGIKEWLQTSKLCSICREYFLLADEMPHSPDDKTNHSHRPLPPQQSTQCYFCITHHVVVLPTSLKKTFTDSTTLRRIQKRAAWVPAQELLEDIHGKSLMDVAPNHDVETGNIPLPEVAADSQRLASTHYTRNNCSYPYF
jgi:hypothetical protein